MGAFFIGLIAGIVVYLAIELLEYLRIDDPIGAVPVHLAERYLGYTVTRLVRHRRLRSAHRDRCRYISTVVTGLFYGGGTGQLVAQFIGSAATVMVSFVGCLRCHVGDRGGY